MSYEKIAHIREVVGKSSKSWEDAINNALKHVYNKHQDIKGLEVIKMTANVSKGKIIEYKSDIKIVVIG